MTKNKSGAPTHHQDNVVNPTNFIIVKNIIVFIKKSKPLIDFLFFSMFYFNVQR